MRGTSVRHSPGMSRQGRGKGPSGKPQARAAGGLLTPALSRHGPEGSNKLWPGVTSSSRSSQLL